MEQKGSLNVLNRSRFIIRLNMVDCLTLTGLILSSCSIGLSIAGKFSFSLSFLYIAMLTDAFDGIMARKFKTERNFGRYLDGFVDVFDYLLAPSIFLYCWGFNEWYSIVLIVFMMSGVVRLSVFNDIGNISDEETGLSYLGMPVFWSVFFLGFIYIAGWSVDTEVLYPVIAVIFSLFAFLMVYNSAFYKFKDWRVMLLVLVSFSVLFALDGFGLADFRSICEYISTFREHLVTALLIIFPAALGGILHMIFVKKDWLPFLKIPVNNWLFGANKTIRGFILMPLLSIPGGYLSYMLFGGSALTINIATTPWFIFGLLAGFAYILFELPNSFIKRRMGILPGENAERFSLFFVILDQLDSSIGGAVLALVYFKSPLVTAICVLFLGPVIAYTVKRILFLFGLKKKNS